MHTTGFRNTAPENLQPSYITSYNPPHPLVFYKSDKREATLTTTPDIYFPPTVSPLWCNLCVPEGPFFTQVFSGRNSAAVLMEARRPWITATLKEPFWKNAVGARGVLIHCVMRDYNHRLIDSAFSENNLGPGTFFCRGFGSRFGFRQQRRDSATFDLQHILFHFQPVPRDKVVLVLSL